MKRLFIMSLVALGLSLLMPGSDVAAKTATYECEFSGTATVEGGTLTKIKITELECE